MRTQSHELTLSYKPVVRLTIKLKAYVRIFLGRIIRTVLPLLIRNRRDNINLADVRPKRILLLNAAHIGDIVIATSLLPVLRSAYPDVEIGFAAASWSSAVLKKHPEIKWLHELDHWRLNRSRREWINKCKHYYQTRRATLKEIRQVKYDLSLSIYPCYPDFLDLAWQANIPIRIGFRQSIFASLATHLVDFPENPFIHQGVRQAEIFKPLGLNKMHLQKRKAFLPNMDAEAVHEVCALLNVKNLGGVRYRIIHPGSGAENRELPPEFWRDIAIKLSNSTIIFTGKGAREAKNISKIITGLGNCINACDRLTWNALIAAIRNAEIVYGVESMVGHVASAVGTKCIMFYSGAAGVARWRPEGDSVTVYTNHLPCAPCMLGCEAMLCKDNTKFQDIVKLD
ncbi:MAG TPA: glycosyltransferase family 9 protein [Alloacidobacterium sp.]|nr:glycosyltransferase family 9 protein [Alloacidobacterium sp.]